MSQPIIHAACPVAIAMVSQSVPAKEGEAQAFAWAKENQGFAGTFADWLDQSAESRAAYENGAAGIPTA